MTHCSHRADAKVVFRLRPTRKNLQIVTQLTVCTTATRHSRITDETNSPQLRPKEKTMTRTKIASTILALTMAYAIPTAAITSTVVGATALNAITATQALAGRKRSSSSRKTLSGGFRRGDRGISNGDLGSGRFRRSNRGIANGDLGSGRFRRGYSGTLRSGR